MLISDNNFENYTQFSISNELLENKNEFTLNTDKFKPGQYSYSLVSRDYANNSQLFQDNTYKFVIPNPIIDYVLPVSLIIIIGIAGISAFTVYKSIQKYSSVVRGFG